MSELKRRMEKALENEIMKHGTMGGEIARVTFNLTEEEVKEFLNGQWFCDSYHIWETDGQEVTISYCENGFNYF